MDEDRSNQIKRAARASAARRKSGEQVSFRPHPTYPKLNVGAEEGRKKSRSRPVKARVSSPTKSKAGSGSTVSRGFGHGLMADIRNGRLPSFLGLVATLVLGYWLLTAPNFRATNVQVMDGRFLNVKEAIAVTALDQQNIFLLDEEEAANKLRKLPYVLDVSLSKALPNEVIIEVTERHSKLNWRVGSVNYLVDQEGVVLESLIQLSADATKFAVIKSLDDKPLKVGDRVDPVAVRSAPLILKKLEENSIGITSLDYSPTSGLIAIGIKEQGSRKILLGTDAELDKKMGILKSLLQDQNLKWTFADLRFTAKPAIQ
ncbi:MAG: FtsQ-type POTRA domain-containing protein [Chloroflexota bacterium]|nr:FtsQ-type POTRA domain-containing protein [Chloroflexota bacterium]